MRNHPPLWLFLRSFFAKERLGQIGALPFISNSSSSMHVSLELSYLHWNIKERVLSPETLLHQIIFILQIIKTSKLSKTLPSRQLSAVPWTANLSIHRYFEHRPIYRWQHPLQCLCGRNCSDVRLLLERFLLTAASACSQTGLQFSRIHEFLCHSCLPMGMDIIFTSSKSEKAGL